MHHTLLISPLPGREVCLSQWKNARAAEAPSVTRLLGPPYDVAAVGGRPPIADMAERRAEFDRLFKEVGEAVLKKDVAEVRWHRLCFVSCVRASVGAEGTPRRLEWAWS